MNQRFRRKIIEVTGCSQIVTHDQKPPRSGLVQLEFPVLFESRQALNFLEGPISPDVHISAP
jgi:hypothetical protein